MILKSNAFRFGSEYYRQITGIAIGTIEPNYANSFMENFQQNLLRHYSQKTGLSSFDIFFIWTSNNGLLDHFMFFSGLIG